MIQVRRLVVLTPENLSRWIPARRRHWLTHLPNVVEAYFVASDATDDELRGAAATREVHKAFRKAYHLSAEQAPLLMLHADRWELPGPFELLR